MTINDDPNLPTVIYDFAPGYMHERLVTQAVAALQAWGRSTRTLEHQMRPYYRNRLANPAPSQMLPIILQHVNVVPESWHDMESTLGPKVARQYVPRADEIPSLVWETQDWLDHWDPEQGDIFRDQLSGKLESGLWRTTSLLDLVAKHLKRAGTNRIEAHAFANPRPELRFSHSETV